MRPLLRYRHLKWHVAYELTHRDYTLFDAKDYSLHFNAAQTEDAAGTISGLPAAETVGALSEQDFEEMTLDRWITLYDQAKELQKSKEDLNREQTAPRTLPDIPYTDIEISLGVPWVSRKIIDDFCYVLRTGDEKLAERRHWAHKIISYEPLPGYWYVADKHRTA